MSVKIFLPLGLEIECPAGADPEEMIAVAQKAVEHSTAWEALVDAVYASDKIDVSSIRFWQGKNPKIRENNNG